jgi:hypothetical protein
MKNVQSPQKALQMPMDDSFKKPDRSSIPRHGSRYRADLSVVQKRFKNRFNFSI